MMADNIIWLDFNDAPEQRDELASDTDALRAGLLDRLEAVLHYLFPQGRIRGGKFYVGDVDGNPGKSLVVELDGPRRGLWKDFSNDNGGGIFELLEQGDPRFSAVSSRVFGTPHDVDVGALCRAYHVDSRQIEAGQVAAALAEPNRGIRVLEVKADRSTLRRLHAAIRAAL